MSDQSAVVMQQNLDRSCWVCFATDEDDRTAEWVRPCRCRGSTKWVHQSCLQRWVDEKQRGNSTARVACPQCNAEYLIVFPKLGPVVYVLDLADRLISKAGPFAAAGIMVGSIYWTAVTYGAVTVMQVVGHKEGLDVMERADPLFLLIGLPTIPVMLILGKMIRWEDYVLRLWRKYSNKLQILNSIFPGIGCPVPRIPAEALLWPITCLPPGSCVELWFSPPSPPSWANSCSAASTPTCRGPFWEESPSWPLKEPLKSISNSSSI
ncbi:hypothetical protein WMY93_017989 [Mugilogobius chulae]|uniref:E3 ubiquitin-protein ligase MARCHF5 n=1 Tax=Mugilogobius chulae TaxID=88201 RepID=A0AAW0NHK3_9GOBI